MMRWIFFGFYAACLIAPMAHGQISAPTDIPNLVYWVDAQDPLANGTTPVDGQVYDTWVEKTGSGANLFSAAGAAAPTYDADGMHVGTNTCGGALRFNGNGVNNRMEAPDVFGGSTGEMTSFMVSREMVRQTNTAWSINGYSGVTTSNVPTSRILMHSPWSNGFIYFDFNGCCNAATTRLFGPIGVPVGGVAVATSYLSDAAQLQYLNVNGNRIDTNTFGSHSSTQGGLVLGNQFNAYVAELVMFDRALTDTEVADMEAYLARKWLNCAETDLVLSKTVNDTTPDEGQQIIYTITLENKGVEEATNVQINDVLPAGLSYVSNTSSQGSVTP